MEPFFLKRSDLTPEQKASIPSPKGNLMNRCDLVINLNETIDHFAFLVLATDPAGLREWIMRGFGRFLQHLVSHPDPNFRCSMDDISRGKSCGIVFKHLVQDSMSYALHREVEEHIGDHSELVRNEWWPFHSCYCGGPFNDTYMTIGDDFETECYHCYASSFQDRLLESRWSFLSYAGRIAEALVAEGVEVIQRSRRKNCTLKERCEMAASIGSSFRRNIVVSPHCHFLMATRRAFNEMLGLDSSHDKGWEYVRSPQHPPPPDFDGYGSNDDEATVDYSEPNDSNDDDEVAEAA